jgi:RNA polymerase sigma-70 factor, ECF subfamily
VSDALKQLELELHALWLRADGGDSAAYAQVLKRLGAHLRGFLKRRMHNNSSDVEDLVQEALLAIHQKRHTYQSDQPLTAWVHAIARYKWVDHWRGQGRRGLLHDDIDDWADQLWVDSDHEAQDVQRDLHRLLATLPERQRVAIECTKLEGLSISETAARTGQSESAVKVNIHRGIKALAEQWSRSS